MTRDAVVRLEEVGMTTIESSNGFVTVAAGQTVVNLEVTTTITFDVVAPTTDGT